MSTVSRRLQSNSAPVSPNARTHSFVDLDAQPSRVLELELQIGELNRTIQFLQLQAQLHNTQFQALERDAADAKERTEAAEHRVVTVQRSNEELQAHLNEVLTRASTAETNTIRLENIITELELQTADQCVEIEKLATENSQLRAALTDLQHVQQHQQAINHLQDVSNPVDFLSHTNQQAGRPSMTDNDAGPLHIHNSNSRCSTPSSLKRNSDNSPTQNHHSDKGTIHLQRPGSCTGENAAPVTSLEYNTVEQELTAMDLNISNISKAAAVAVDDAIAYSNPLQGPQLVPLQFQVSGTLEGAPSSSSSLDVSEHLDNYTNGTKNNDNNNEAVVGLRTSVHSFTPIKRPVQPSSTGTVFGVKKNAAHRGLGLRHASSRSTHSRPSMLTRHHHQRPHRETYNSAPAFHEIQHAYNKVLKEEREKSDPVQKWVRNVYSCHSAIETDPKKVDSLVRGVCGIFEENVLSLPLEKTGPCSYKLGAAKTVMRLVNGRLMAKSGPSCVDLFEWIGRQPVSQK